MSIQAELLGERDPFGYGCPVEPENKVDRKLCLCSSPNGANSVAARADYRQQRIN